MATAGGEKANQSSTKNKFCFHKILKLYYIAIKLSTRLFPYVPHRTDYSRVEGLRKGIFGTVTCGAAVSSSGGDNRGMGGCSARGSCRRCWNWTGNTKTRGKQKVPPPPKKTEKLENLHYVA